MSVTKYGRCVAASSKYLPQDEEDEEEDAGAGEGDEASASFVLIFALSAQGRREEEEEEEDEEGEGGEGEEGVCVHAAVRPSVQALPVLSVTARPRGPESGQGQV